MKFLRLFTFSILSSLLLFTGCAASKPSTSATMPPPSEEVVTTTTQTTTTETTSESVAVPPMDTGEMIPISKLPTKYGHPYAIRTQWPGLVKSPFAQDKKLVNVEGLASGTAARCPHTGKVFIVP